MTRKDISIHELHVAKTSIFCLITDCASTADGSTSIVHELRDFYKTLKQEVYKSSVCSLRAHAPAIKFAKQKYFRNTFFSKTQFDLL